VQVNANRRSKKMKSMDQIEIYDLATFFIAFGMVIGFALR